MFFIFFKTAEQTPCLAPRAGVDEKRKGKIPLALPYPPRAEKKIGAKAPRRAKQKNGRRKVIPPAPVLRVLPRALNLDVLRVVDVGAAEAEEF